jgi:hypothetical protein
MDVVINIGTAFHRVCSLYTIPDVGTKFLIVLPNMAVSIA